MWPCSCPARRLAAAAIGRVRSSLAPQPTTPLLQPHPGLQHLQRLLSQTDARISSSPARQNIPRKRVTSLAVTSHHLGRARASSSS